MLRDVWYAAAWPEDIPIGAVLARKIAGVDVVLARLENGDLLALEDVCPHRLIPLSLGCVKGNHLQCGYHGLEFDSQGKCAANPHAPHVTPEAMSTRAFAVEEQDGVVWIWIGRATQRPPHRPPTLPGMDIAEYRVGKGYLQGVGGYELLNDNILDLSHIAFIHPNLGSEAVTRAKHGATIDGDCVTSWRYMRDEVLPERLARAYGFEGKTVDRRLSVQWRPASVMVLTVEIGPAGSEALDLISRTMHLITPETERTCHYLFAGSRARASCSEDDMQRFVEALSSAFVNEDKPFIEAQQRSLDLVAPARQPILLSIDKGAAAARRINQRLAKAEASNQPQKA